MSTTQRPQVLIVHSSPVIAAGLSSSLRPDCEVAVRPGLQLNDRAMLELAATAVVVADLDSGIALMQHCRSLPWMRQRSPRCLVVSHATRGGWVQKALEHGVRGYLTADCGVHELLDAVRAVERGQRSLCATASASVADSLAHEALTPRETDVLHWLVRGLDNKSIAQCLNISLGTVKTHVKALLAKLSAVSRTQAVTTALRRGLVADDAAVMVHRRRTAEHGTTVSA